VGFVDDSPVVGVTLFRSPEGRHLVDVFDRVGVGFEERVIRPKLVTLESPRDLKNEVGRQNGGG